MKLALLIVCGGGVSFLVYVLAALVREYAGPRHREVEAYLAKFYPLRRRKELIVMNPNAVARKFPIKAGEQIALGLLVIAGFAIPAHGQPAINGLEPANPTGAEATANNPQLSQEVLQELDAMKKSFGDVVRTHDASKRLEIRLARIIMLTTLLTIGVAPRLQGQAAAQPADTSSTASPATTWQYGGFVDAGYLHDFNDPANHLFRSRGTTFRVNEVNLNMTALYLRKVASEGSRWGTELTWQAGSDSEVFGYSATAPNLDGSKWLRHLGPTDISYLAPVGEGLTVQGGIFNSFIGYDSLYAKDNFSYTRPWGADFTPYLMLGVNAQYPLTPKLSGAVFIVNGYWHLAHANNVPSSGGQLSYKPIQNLTVKQTVLYGPHQADTSVQFWRFLSDSIAEWKKDQATVAFEYQVSEEEVAALGTPRALWMSAQLPAHWAFKKHWSVTLRPETAWDRNGRWTGFSQTVKAVTSTAEYRVPYRAATLIVRLEHRWDDSRGPQGGFFKDGEESPGAVGLTPTQHLFGVGMILTFDSTFRP